MGLKTLAKSLQRDFVPGGPSVDVRKLSFRRTTEDEAFQCCAKTTYDPQSGPIFCGRVAEFVAEVPEQGGHVAICKRHVLDLPPEVRPE